MSGNAMIDAALKKGGTKAIAYAIPGAGEVLAAKNAAQMAAKPVAWLIACCACVFFSIFIGTLGGWIQQKNLGSKADETKKQNLKNSWIAFLVLFLCFLGIWFAVHKASTYKVAGIF